MRKILPAPFFNRSAVSVARRLVGCFLARRVGKHTYRFLITETEAYEGPRDLASHASRGKTPRNAVMFGKPGVLYVYFVYGMHWMLNVVTGKPGYPAAVLIRGTQGYSGPGRLTKALKITGRLTGKQANTRTGLWFEQGIAVRSRHIKRTPRIGVAYAGPLWSKKPYRFFIQREP